MNDRRFVLDTNVLVSAMLVETGLPFKVLEAAERTGSLLVSDPTVEELLSVVARPRFDRYLPLELRLEFVRSITYRATYIEIVRRITACRDSRDDKFLELAVNGQADAIVTGDEDLLVLHPFEGIPIVTSQVFVDQFTESA